MYTQNEYVNIQLNRDARDRAFQEAETLRTLRQAGLLQPSPVTRAYRFAAGRLGHVLVALGQTLVRVERGSNPTLNPSGSD